MGEAERHIGFDASAGNEFWSTVASVRSMDQPVESGAAQAYLARHVQLWRQ